MKLSLVTPTHRPDYLPEAFDSLLLQDHTDWEWVIVPNSGAVIPEHIAAHPQVRVIPAPPSELQRIGALKRFACDQATGDAFVEFDHDDLLVPGILSSVAMHLRAGAGFVYSDSAVFVEDGKATPVGYSEQFGWETYDFHVFGKKFIATRCFDVTPRMLCEVYYAPDHIRCWSREAYERTGGHDESMMAGDDHDLICRTYLAGVEFHHTASAGYLYRNHPGNSFKAYSKDVQFQSARNRDKYLYDLMAEWCRREGHPIIDLQEPGHLTYLNGQPKILAEDNSIGYVRAYDCLQLVPQEKIVDLANEVYRVLVPSGFWCSAVPSTLGNGAFAPHHRSYWNRHTFDYFCASEFSRRIPEIKARFQSVRSFDTYPQAGHRELGLLYTYTDLCALKGQRQPGQVSI